MHENAIPPLQYSRAERGHTYRRLGDTRLMIRFFLAATVALGASLAANAQVAPWPTAWQANFNVDGTPKPLNDPADSTIWPNKTSNANSDEWIAKNHDSIRQMRPRLLVLNFSNQVDPAKPMRLADDLVAAVRESTRYHGYSNPGAPAFLQYTVWRYVDFRDPDSTTKNTREAPIKPHVKEGINCDYNAFFGDKMAKMIGVRDPKDPARFLRLDELLDKGFVHEVWFTAAATGEWVCLESVELKPVYDAQFHKVPGKVVESGNGGDPDRKWTGRSVRINCLNHDRGIGCGLENLSHSFEGMAHGNAIPYFTKYFNEFAGFDLDTRFSLPFNSFYPLWGEGKGISYPDAHTAVVTDGKQTWTLKNYVAAGGNVHFPPNARKHYDQENSALVMSTIEGWRQGGGPGGKDIAKPFSAATLNKYAPLCPDCMGKWLVYWRQNIPGLDNKSKDDNGKPMKNWWPFLFY